MYPLSPPKTGRTLRLSALTQLLLTASLFLFGQFAFGQSGKVFRDYNSDGMKQATEPLIAGVVVTAHTSANVLCATATTTTVADGSGNNYSLTGCSGSVRVEFTIPAAAAAVCGLSNDLDFTAFNGGAYGSSVQFTTSTGTANFAVGNPHQYTSPTLTNPKVFTSCYVSGNNSGLGNVGAADAFIGVDYNPTGNAAPAPGHYANTKQIGSTWGVAYSKQAKMIFTAAVLKRHTGLGPLGSGGIYMINPAIQLPLLTSVTNFLDFDAIGIPTSGTGTYAGTSVAGPTVAFSDVIGTNTERGLGLNTNSGEKDAQALAQSGRVSFGDLDLSDDGRYLYVMNLYDRKLYEIDLTDAANPVAPTSSNKATKIRSWAIPEPCGAGTGVARPWGIDFYRGKPYIGVVCDAATSQAVADLKFTVYELDPSSGVFTSKFTNPLNFPRGLTNGFETGSGAANGNNRKGWFGWTDDWSKMIQGTPSVTWPQPVLSDIEFDTDGSMVLGFLDRTGLQGGWNNLGPITGVNTLYRAIIGGDILRAYKRTDCDWELESAGKEGPSSPKAATGGATNGEGPGGGEFYYEEFFATQHRETGLGGLGILFGKGEVVSTIYDPFRYDSFGLGWFNNTTGKKTKGFEVFFTNNTNSTPTSGTFSKGLSLGDVEIQNELPPLEIGNRVWKDTDKDGIQDADEVGVDGVEFELYEGTTATGTPAQTVTSAMVNGQAGTWYFTDLKTNQDYVIKVKTALGTGALATCTAYSVTGAGTTTTDNNTSTGTITLKTGNAGENAHSYDVGVVEAAACIKPVISQVAVTPATCKTSGGGNNDAKIVFKASGGDKYGISKGATYTGPAYATATAIAAGGGELLNITNESSKWTIRVFNADNSCFKDSTVILDCNRCVVLCPNISILIGEQTDSGEKVVIMPLDPNSPKPPCDLPDTGGDGITIDEVNKIAYIGSPFSNPIKAYSFASAQFLSPITPSSGTNSYDITLSVDRKYILRGATGAGAVEKIRISDGTVVVSRATSFFTNDGEKKIWGVAVQGAKVYITTGYNDFNTIGKSTIQVMDSTFSNPQLVVTRNDGKIYVGITVDKDGTLWATVDGYGAGDLIEHLAADGSIIKKYPITSSNNEDTKRPFDIEFGPDGNLYVATFYGDCVSKLTLDSPSNPNFGVVSTYIGFEPSVRSKNLAFVCGDVICPCAVPKRLVTATDPTCVVAGKIELTSVTGGDKYGISKGAIYTGPAYAAATANGTLPKIIKNNISNTADSVYTIRVFASDVCFIDTTVTVKAAPVKPTIAQQTGSPFCRAAGTTYTIKFTATGGTVTTVPSFVVTGDSVANIPIATASVKVLVISAGGCKDSVTITAPNCLIPQGSIGDYVWKDANDNGINDEPTSAGVKGVKVQLLNNKGEIMVNTALSGSQQVPPVATTATGNVFGSFNPINDSLKIKVSYSGLSSGPTMAHLHTGAIGANGGVAVSFTGFPTTTSGVYNAAVKLTSAQKTSLLANLLYVNIHTATNGGGELRSQLVLCDTTDDEGKYSFDELPSGQYQVKILTSSLPASCLISSMANKGTDDTKDSDFSPTTGLSQLITIDVSKSTTDTLRKNPQVDAALYSPKGSLGDFVWKDINNNGLQDETTSNGGGVKDVIVELYRNAGTTPFAKDTTDTTGKYLFSNLDAGTYYIKLVSASIPVGCAISTMKDIPSDDAKDSDVDATGKSGNYVIDPTNAAKKDILTVDAALYTPCIKPNAGPDQTLECGTTAPTTANLVDAATGQKWKVLSVPSGITVSVTTPEGLVSGMTLPGTYSFVLQTQSADSLACRDTVNVIVPDCGCPTVDVITPGASVCKDSLFTTLTVAIVGNNTSGISAEWYADATGGSPLGTGLSFTPAGTATVAVSFYVQLTGVTGTCAEVARTEVIVGVQNCAKFVDLALKKGINTKIAKIGDDLIYTIKVFSQPLAGSVAATGVEVTDSIANTVQFVAGSFAASRGNATITGNVIKWTIGGIDSNPGMDGDTVTLTYKVKATMSGVHFNTAEISKTTEKDVDSTPSNGKDTEDDLDRQCFTVPFTLCPGEQVRITAPSNLTNVVWSKTVNGQTTVAGSGNEILVSEVGSYTFMATNKTCPASGCCPVIIEPGINCCPVELCIPFTITKKKR